MKNKVKQTVAVLALLVLLSLALFGCTAGEKSDPVRLSLAITGSNVKSENDTGTKGYVSAIVRNEHTFFKAKTTVVVELYRSQFYCENCEDMVLAGAKSTENLQQGEELCATMWTLNKCMYWQARVRYKINEGEWKTINSGTARYDAGGNFITFNSSEVIDYTHPDSVYLYGSYANPLHINITDEEEIHRYVSLFRYEKFKRTEVSEYDLFVLQTYDPYAYNVMFSFGKLTVTAVVYRNYFVYVNYLGEYYRAEVNALEYNIIVNYGLEVEDNA